MGKQQWWLIGAVGVAVGLAAALQVVSNRPAPQPSAVASDVQFGPRPKLKGPDSAPVKVVEFGDFQ